MTQTPIALEKATEEVKAWLDYKKIDNKERDENKKFVDKLVSSVEAGILSIDPDTFVSKHTLKFPVKDSAGNTILSELNYQPRAGIGSLLSKTGNLNGIGMDMYTAYGSSLSGAPMGDIKRMDSEDFKIMQAVVTFFL